MHHKHQFTICPDGLTTITPDGVVIQNRLAVPKDGYDKTPVKVNLHHDLSLQVHGARFAVVKKLSLDEALDLQLQLAYMLREHVATKRG